ncbi:MAG: hypothetical protein OEW67_15355 [Cyclobacteriaceae bacterium]|nr:hypothetical protein [Cyclobacteriaceae bacterium]
MKVNVFFSFLVLIVITQTIYGQGCSDAGFCTMGAMKPDQAYGNKINFKLRSIELSQYRGKTTLSPIVWVSNLDATIGINSKTALQVKIPYQMIEGNLGSTKGVGDISISATRQVFHSDKFDINATIGGKIPSNGSDLKKQDNEFGSINQDYPMYYQTSLGSYDIVAGFSLISKKWLIAFGYQDALTANNNNFKWGEWSGYPTPEMATGVPVQYILDHDKATKLKRGSDIMFRVERNWRFSNYNFSFGALPIYRITKDQINTLTNWYPDGIYKKVDKTTGLALSLLASAGYHFNVNSSVKLIIGYKLVDREVNPDGLTRHAVQTIAYVFRF